MGRLRVLMIGFLLLITFIACLSTEKAFSSMNDSPSFSVKVERKIVIQNGGYIMINDTFLITPINEYAQSPSFYLIGIPRDFYGNLVYSSAYDLYGALQTEISEEDYAFKWLNISLRAGEVGRGQPYNFTLITVFSNLIERGAENRFRAVFPLHPVLRDKSELCNVTLILPPDAEVSPEGFPHDIFLNMTGDFRLLNNLTRPLPAYTSISSWVEFTDETFSILKILEVRREISIDGWGRIYVRDIYDVEMVNVANLNVILPPSSADISVYDIYGRYPENSVLIEEGGRSGVFVVVTLSDKLRNSERAKIAISYSLPFWKYIKRDDWQKYSLSIKITKPDEWFIPRIIVSILLPEGANIISENHHPEISYEKISFFQEKITIVYYNVTRYDEFKLLGIKYNYTFLWAALRPTVLIMVLISLASIFVAFVKPFSGVRVATFSPERLKSFIEVYGEVEHISSELESIRQEYVRGRVPKRRYQLTKRMLEEKLHAAEKKLMNLKAELESAEGHYAEMIKRLERASASIEASKRSIEEADLKLHRREISAEEHRKIVEEYTRKMDEAKAIIEEILLRLKEETL